MDVVNPNMASSEDGEAAVRELRDTLEETFDMLTKMTDQTNSDDLRPAPLPSNKKSLEFTRAVLKHSFTASKIADLVKGLRDMRSDAKVCLTELEASFQHTLDLYGDMKHGLERITSRGSFFSTSTNLRARIDLLTWLKEWEETWVAIRQRESTSVSHLVSSHTPFSLIIGLHFVTFQPDRCRKAHPTHFGPIYSVF